jgi:uncharacterized repeat protein (TIGR02543 family)
LGNPFTASTTVSGDITVYAQWTEVIPNSYTFTFRLNDGTERVWETKTVTAPATTIGAADFPADPTRTGHTFAGWNTQADGSGSAFAATTTVSAGITVYAQWTEIIPNSYTVTFRLNDGTERVWETKTVTAPATTIGAAGFPADPTRTGYTFAGWNTASDGTGSPFAASTVVSGDMTVYAQWTGETYTITFKDNYAPDTTLHTTTVTVPATTIGAADFPADPTRSVSTFAGWNTQANGWGNPFAASTMVSGDMTVYAQWTGETYTITFKGNYSRDTTLHSTTVTVPATTIGAADFPADPTRTRYTFAGWNTASDGTGSPFAASTMVSGDITVYAQWTGETYTITFKGNYAWDTTLHITTVTVPATTIGATGFPADPTRTGYTFAGWNTQADGLGSGFDASAMVSGDMTVYAKWTPGASVQINLQPQANPSLFDTLIFKDAQASFSAAGTEYTSWQWYWDGDPISGEELNTYILEANSKTPGVYELSVVVTTTGNAKLSARCRVTIKDK